MGALAKKQRPVDQQEGVGAISIEGQIVLFDTDDFNFDGRTPAVVIRKDKSIGIELPLEYAPGLWTSGPRKSAYGVGNLGKGRFRAIEACTVLGRVISDGKRAAPQDRIERLVEQLSFALEGEYGGDYCVTIKSGGAVDYEWGCAA